MKDNRGCRGKKKTLSLKKCENLHKTRLKNVLTFFSKYGIIETERRRVYVQQSS
nr:MAG TPA: hypothetical protein [Caudoviricetes sp.]